MLGNASSGLPVGELVAKPLGEAMDLLGVHSIEHPLERFLAAGEQSRAVLLGEDSSFRTFFWGSAYWGVAPVGGLAPEVRAAQCSHDATALTSSSKKLS